MVSITTHGYFYSSSEYINLTTLMGKNKEDCFSLNESSINRAMVFFFVWCFFFFFCLFWVFLSFLFSLGPYPWHMEVPRLGVQSEL